MTLSREYRGGPLIVHCDTCTETAQLISNDNIIGGNEARELGFRRVEKEGGKWSHTCKDCAA